MFVKVLTVNIQLFSLCSGSPWCTESADCFHPVTGEKAIHTNTHYPLSMLNSAFFIYLSSPNLVVQKYEIIDTVKLAPRWCSFLGRRLSTAGAVTASFSNSTYNMFYSWLNRQSGQNINHLCLVWSQSCRLGFHCGRNSLRQFVNPWFD